MKSVARARAEPNLAPGRPALSEAARLPRLSGLNRYSMFVGTMKVILPAMAVALILLVVAWPQFSANKENFRIGISQLGFGRPENLSMLNARFDGLDDRDRPFTITSDVATQSRDDENLIDLELPKGDMTLSDGAWLAVTARAGRYDRKKRLLDLNGAVSLFHDKGFELRTEAARIDLVDASAEGNMPVRGQGTFGQIESEGFRVLDRGRRIIFTGRSRLTLLPSAEGASR